MLRSVLWVAKLIPVGITSVPSGLSAANELVAVQGHAGRRQPLLGERPEADQVAVLGGQRPPVGRERDELDGAVEVERPGQGLAAGDGPEPGRVVGRAGHEHPAVGAEGRAEHGVLVLQGRPDGDGPWRPRRAGRRAFESRGRRDTARRG